MVKAMFQNEYVLWQDIEFVSTINVDGNLF